MKKIILILVLSLTGCIGSAEAPNVVEYHYRPTTYREWALKKELEGLGYKNVTFQIPMCSNSKYVRTYYLRMTPQFNITTRNIDSMVRFRDSLSEELYLNIIEDSVLVDLKELFIGIEYPRPKRCKTCEYSSHEYSIEELASKCNVKVVRDGNGGYKRIPLKW